MSRLPGGVVPPPVIELAVASVRAAPARCGSTRVVAVDGRSGAGKSTLAGLIAAALDAPVLGMDQLYPGWDGLEGGVQRLAEEVLPQLARGGPVAYRRWDWMRGRPGREVVLEPAAAGSPLATVVVEGVGCGAGVVRARLGLLVWVSAPTVLRRADALARDGAAYVRNWDRWAAQEERHLRRERTATAADLVLLRGPDGRLSRRRPRRPG